MGTVYALSAACRAFLFAVLLSFFCLTASATVHNITIDNTGFSPFTTNANVGDTILWTWQAGTHTTTSGNVPNGAATWNSPLTNASPNFMYIITTAGTYNYFCSVHVGMTGIINVAASGVENLDVLETVTLYPQPCNKELTVDFSKTESSAGIKTVELVNYYGQTVYSATVDAGIQSLRIEVANLPSGIYFCSVSVANSRRVIKVMKDR